MAGRLRAMQVRRRAVMARALVEFFGAQAARVLRRYFAGLNLPDHLPGLEDANQKTWQTWAYETHTYIAELNGFLLPLSFFEYKEMGDDLFPPSEDDLLDRLVVSHVAGQWIDSARLADDLVGTPTAHEADPALQRHLAVSGERITAINDATRANVQEVLTTGASRGYSPWQMAHGVPADNYRGIAAVVQETYRGRSETIARTELALASAQATLDRYRDASVEEVDVDDGPDCGWDGHDDPDIADGSRRTIDEADAMELSHPNCVRSFTPVIGESQDDGAPDEGDAEPGDDGESVDDQVGTGSSLPDEGEPDTAAPVDDTYSALAAREFDVGSEEPPPQQERAPRPSRAVPSAEPRMDASLMSAADVRATMEHIDKNTPGNVEAMAKLDAAQVAERVAYRTWSWSSSPTPAERSAWQEAIKRVDEAKATLEKIQAPASKQLAGLMDHPVPASIELVFSDKFSPEQEAVIRRGFDAFKSIVGNQINLDEFGHEQIRVALASGQSGMGPGQESRSFYRLGTMYFPPNMMDPGTVVHEAAHWLEGRASAASHGVLVHYAERTAGEELKPLGGGYAKTEMTRKDKFADPYMGKDYGVPGPFHELLSMAVEMLYRDPLEFARADAKTFDFVWNLLHPNALIGEHPPVVAAPIAVAPPPARPPARRPRATPTPPDTVPVVKPPRDKHGHLIKPPRDISVTPPPARPRPARTPRVTPPPLPPVTVVPKPARDKYGHPIKPPRLKSRTDAMQLAMARGRR